MTSKLRASLKQSHPTIPWKQVSGFRNILVHNYLGEIDPQTLFTVIRDHLPRLEAAVHAMLAERGTEPSSD